MVFIIAVALVATGSSLVSAGGASELAPTRACDAAFSFEVGIPATRLCLQNVQISVSPTNGSTFVVPVMVLKTGATTMLDIMYLLSSETLGHTGPIENVTSSDVPFAISVPSGMISDKITFSNASIVFADGDVIIYSYTVSAPVGSDGYYAILPPFYYGTYPALAVGADPDHLNASALGAWGFSGAMQSGEFALPSIVVRTGNMVLVNATVPMIPTCPNRACVIISRSGS